MKVIWNWRNVHDVELRKLYIPPDLFRMKEEKRIWVSWSCRMNVTWDLHTGLWEILSDNEQPTLLLGAQMYTKLHTQWHIQCCHRWLNSLSETLLHSHCSNTINISTVVMLGFWLCQFDTGSLAWWLSQLSFFFGCLNLTHWGRGF